MARSARCPSCGAELTRNREHLEGGAMAKRYGRPSPQYRYEHYDPR